MDPRRRKMLGVIRRNANDVVLDYQLRKNLIKEGHVVEFLEGEECMGKGCSFCVISSCPTCGRINMIGEAVFLIDEEPFVKLGLQSLAAMAAEPPRQ